MELVLCAKEGWMHDYEETEKTLCEYIVDYLTSEGVTIPVRCGECEKKQECKNAQYLGENGFCSYGERKEE